MRPKGAVEGFSPGHVPDESEPYEPEDDVAVEPEDEDHEYQPNRGDLACLICGQPKGACTEEP